MGYSQLNTMITFINIHISQHFPLHPKTLLQKIRLHKHLESISENSDKQKSEYTSCQQTRVFHLREKVKPMW